MELTPSDMALRYAAIGWNVIPVQGKRPVGEKWQERASSDQVAVAKLFATSPHDGVGVTLGQRSGIIDFDCDSEAAEQTLLALFDGRVPRTPSFQSARGRHVLFRWTDKLPQGSIKIVIDGLEIRLGNGDKGCQSVFPPSGGRVWTIDEDTLLAEIPAAVVDKINARFAELNKPKRFEPVPQSYSNSNGDDRLNVPRWLEKHGREIIGRTDGSDGVTRFHVECPGVAAHTTNNSWRDCCVTQDTSGKLGGCCLHSSCGMSSWRELKRAIGEPGYDDYHELDQTPVPIVDPIGSFADMGIPVSGPDGGLLCTQKHSEYNSVYKSEPRQTPCKIGVSTISEDSVYNVYGGRTWPSPIPFAGDAVAKLPVDAIPTSVRGYLTQLAEFTQTPIDLAVGMWIAATAIAVQKKFVVDCGWIEQLCLYILALMEPGNRKSAVVSAVSAPIRQYESNRRQELAPSIREARSTFEVRTKQRNRLMDDAAKAQMPTDRESILHEIRQLDEEIGNSPVPSEPTMLASDCTAEHMATLMTRNQGKLGVLTAEGDLFDILAGRYSGKPNIGIVLNAHSGDEVRVDRGNRPSELIRSPALSMGFCAQPEVLRGLLQQKQFRGRGLMGRLLFQIPPSLLGHRKIDPQPINPVVEHSYQQLMFTILNLPTTVNDGEIVPTSIRLSRQAVSLFRVFRVQNEEAFLELNSLSQIKDWGGKLAGAVARIAGIFHIAEHAVLNPMPLEISGSTMANAIRIGDYLTSHAQAAFQVMGCDENRALAELIASTIKKHNMATFNRRDIHQHVRRSVTKPDDLDAPLQLLADHCCIRERQEPATPRGRKPSPSYETNPMLLAV